MASAKPHRVLLVIEILEMILVKTDMQTLLTSAQRVCHKWHDLIQYSADLQAALFFKPVRYTLPDGTPAIRNPLLDKRIWPWYCSTHTKKWGAAPVEGGAKIPEIRPGDDDRFLRDGASWSGMLFQQPPRSCIGLIEKDGGEVDGPAYTKVKLLKGDQLRIGDVINAYPLPHACLHPLPQEGLLWYGLIHTKEIIKRASYMRAYADDAEKHGDIHKSQVEYASSVYLHDCDIVIFVLHCCWFRGQVKRNLRPPEMYSPGLHRWLRELEGELIPGQISIPMPMLSD